MATKYQNQEETSEPASEPIGMRRRKPVGKVREMAPGGEVKLFKGGFVFQDRWQNKPQQRPWDLPNPNPNRSLTLTAR